jgi:DNA replication and repair protein RecF
MAMSKDRAGKTILRLNSQNQNRASALAKHLPVQTILPEAAELVLGGPAERRAYLDWGVFHVEQGLVEAARRYRRVLTQRNAWLKSLAGKTPSINEDPWFEQLLEYGCAVGEMRQRYVATLGPLLKSTLSRLSPGMDVSIEYDWGGIVDVSSAEKKLGESWPRDVKFGMTHRGPHRADLRFLTADQLVSERVSRGQAKLISSAAILAQAELLYQHSGTKSLFLIDDFGAELDAEHWQLFLRTLLGLQCQVIATSTDPLNRAQSWVDDLEELRVFHVKHGEIESTQ